jgi:predicted deacylase
VVIEASLHADEVPGLLVAHHLRLRLGELEALGALRGEVVLVVFANPIGLSQWVLASHEGRFELASGENFNRLYADLAPHAAAILEARLRSGTRVGVVEARAALRQACAELVVTTELQSLRRRLLGLAIDAEVVLDLRCEYEGVLDRVVEAGRGAVGAHWPADRVPRRLRGRDGGTAGRARRRSRIRAGRCRGDPRLPGVARPHCRRAGAASRTGL